MAALERRVLNLERRYREMSTTLDRLVKSLEREKDLTAAMQTLVTKLAAEIRAHAADEQKITQLADELDERNEALAAAVTANTPFEESGNR
jgi:predicted  nucleic acid-binding Zn-ribbon protein